MILFQKCWSIIRNFIMDQSVNSITANVNDKQIKIILDHWSLLAMGEGHIILKNDSIDDWLYWKVLMICIHEINSVPQPFQQLYLSIIQNMPNIKDYLLLRELVELNSDQKLILAKFIEVRLKLPHKVSKNYRVHLAQNLNRSKKAWSFSLQFKPKTAIPDKYSHIFIQKIKQKYAISSQNIVQRLNNRPISEKTRWFKKNALKKAKKNLNPAEIFGFQTQNNHNLVDKLNQFQGFSSEFTMSTDEKITLNSNIFKTLNERQILAGITKLQLLFIDPSDTIDTQFLQLWNRQVHTKQIYSKIQSNIQKKLSTEIDLKCKIEQLLQSSVVKQVEMKLNDEQKLEDMFRFLISLSWRDVSLFIRLRINQESKQIEDYDISIIDYELKEASKLKETIQKDEKFLINYLKFLQIL